MRIYWRILRYVRPYKGAIATHALFTVLAVIFGSFSIAMLQPVLKLLFSGENLTDIAARAPEYEFSVKYLLKYINFRIANLVEDGTIESRTNALLIIIGSVVTLNILGNVFSYFSVYFIGNIRTWTVEGIRSDLFNRLKGLQVSYFETGKKGDIMTRLTSDVNEVESSVAVTFESVLRDPLTIIAFMYLMFDFSWKLTLFIFVLLPLSAVLIGFIARSLKRDAFRSQEVFSSIMSLIDETVSGIRIIKAFNAENYISRIFHRYNSGYGKLHRKQWHKRMLAPPISEIMGVLTVALILWFGGQLVFQGTMDAEGFIVYIFFFIQILKPAKSLSGALSHIYKGIASGERIFNLMDTEVTIKDKPAASGVSDFKQSLRFNNLSFYYYKNEYVLRNIDLEIPKGKMYALVGPSGCGKTTLAEMLPRFYDPVEGSVTLDGADLRDLKVKDLRELIAIVTQEPILFNDSIYNNIAFGMHPVTEDQVMEAAKAANAHGFISETENGYRTMIGDRGALLSGGQRQRISIARAILKNPPILILDEATSALDTASEKIVQDALFRLMQHRTSLVIAHRLSTVQDADCIIAMDRGRIVEKGTHNELIAKDGLYKQLYSLQQVGMKE
ncbi:MAG: ABC transporter ATP-binding protein [Bacteroidia bacterium]